jgi:hypothetical protein
MARDKALPIIDCVALGRPRIRGPQGCSPSSELGPLVSTRARMDGGEVGAACCKAHGYEASHGLMATSWFLKKKSWPPVHILFNYYPSLVLHL